MKKIQIAARFKPFSHTPGISCVIPRSCSILTTYPTLLRIDRHEVILPITGPVQNFTMQQDLEKDCVFVFGKAREGYFKLKIEAHDSGFHILSQKGPIKNIEIEEEVCFHSDGLIERLSLGSHKHQDWDLVKRRTDLKEILPILFFLGQKIPHINSEPLKGTARLLELPEKRFQLEAALLAFFQAGFSHLLVPRLFDDQYQGLAPAEEAKGNPFYLLQEGASLVRSLFFHQNERRLKLLPNLPISFDAGRMMNVEAPGIGTIDFEWSKKILKRTILRADTSGEIFFDLQKEIKTFRVNKKTQLKRSEPLLLTKNKTYYLDRFQK